MPKPIKKQQWSNIDVFGLIRGLGIWDSQYKTLQYVRRPFDTPLTIKDKIQKLNDNPPSLTKQGLLNGLCAEFGLSTYNVTNKKIFQLTYYPSCSGGIDIQDIWVRYRPVGATGVWYDLLPQVWPSGYETATSGFIVWTNDNFVLLSGYKNFNYSNHLEIISELDDNTELQITYYIDYIDEYNNKQLLLYTDACNINDPNDKRFIYRKENYVAPESGIVVYTLYDIPSDLKSVYFNDENQATEQLYKIKKYFNDQYKSTWKNIKNNSTIWDIQDIYCSGEIPNFYDPIVPKNIKHCIAANKEIGTFFSGYIGGIEKLSNALYLSEIVQVDDNNDDTQKWYIRIYPGRFYIDGIPYRLFENPVIEHIEFINGMADIPSGLVRGMYTILAVDGYYDGCVEQDQYLSGLVFEDYWYPTGKGGNSEWHYIYRRRPYLTAQDGYEIKLDVGEYNIDFKNRKIYLNSPFNSGILIYDATLIPSGRIINFDINPLNQDLINIQKFFLYLVNKE